jgi:hypothetical protein
MSDEAFYAVCMVIAIGVPALLYLAIRRLEAKMRAKIIDEIKKQ